MTLFAAYRSRSQYHRLRGGDSVWPRIERRAAGSPRGIHPKYFRRRFYRVRLKNVRKQSLLSTVSDRGIRISYMQPRSYFVSRHKKAPLVDFIHAALLRAGCRVLYSPDPSAAPYRFVFETPGGERLGIIVYAFFANSRPTKNRPLDEHRFQVKYGPDTKTVHQLWQDPYLLYTTLFCGIDPERGIFVGADPVLHSPTRFFISIEYKEESVQKILRDRWCSWEREHRANSDEPIEVLVGGTQESFLRYVRFERDSLGEAPGHRQLLAETLVTPVTLAQLPIAEINSLIPPPRTLHALADEFQLTEREVLDLIANTRRMKMAVRGGVAEEHLVRALRKVEGVENCHRNDGEGQADVDLLFKAVPLKVECKNVLRERAASSGLARMDFQRTRASKGDPWSRFYSPADFDIVAACLHAVEQKWTFSYVLSSALDRHPKCDAKFTNNVRIDSRWSKDAGEVLTEAARLKG